MLEMALVVGLLGGLVGLAVLLTRTPWHWLIGGGTICVVVGMVASIALGTWYHVRLYRLLKARDLVRPRWWLFPTRQHALLDPEVLRPALRPFFFGGASFVLAIVGCVLFAYGAFKAPE